MGMAVTFQTLQRLCRAGQSRFPCLPIAPIIIRIYERSDRSSMDKMVLEGRESLQSILHLSISVSRPFSPSNSRNIRRIYEGNYALLPLDIRRFSAGRAANHSPSIFIILIPFPFAASGVFPASLPEFFARSPGSI